MESLTFQLFSLHNTVNYRGGNDVLSLFGRTGTGNSVRLDVEGFRPYIFLEMDYTKWRESVWSPLSFVMVHDSLRRRYDEMETQEEMCTLLAHRMRKPPIMPTLTCEDGFGIKEVPLDGAPRPFLRLEFRNWHQLQKLKRTMREFAIITAESLALGSLLSNVLDGRVGTEAERQVLVPLIRALEDCRALKFKTFEGCYDCGSMFLIHYNVKPSGWLCVSPVTALACAPDTRVREFSCSYTASLKVEEGNGPPLSQVRILSYDIEAVPFAVGDGTTLFPQPERDPICTIGIACYEYGTEALEMHALSVGDTEEGWSRADDPSNDDYDPSKVTLHTFTTENDMLMFFASFIREYDPDFISGFNILNFDNYYTLKRASYKCSSGEALWWGRTKKECVPEKRFTSSNQLGGREFWDVRIVGREWFDLYNITKIDHKLSSYKLDSVAEHFLGTKKIEISYDDIPTMCRTPAGRKRLAVYCVKDAFLPLQLCIKLCKLQNAVSLSYVTGAPINHILNRGQQIRTLNLIVRHVRTHKPRLYVPDRTEENTEGFQGAVVIDPIKGFYTRPVVVLDFASLYPSTMIANNMCFSTKISRADAEKHGLQHGKDFLAIRDFKREGTSFEFIDKPSDTCFLMSDRRRGVLPEILASLLSARKAEKKLMKKCKEGSLAYGVHNGNQLALKISANSVYGFTGASRGVLTDPEISSAVTRRGRAMTNEASFVAETAFEGTRTVYGDTDSIFVELGESICPTEGKTNAEVLAKAQEVGEMLSARITKQYRAPNDLEYEKTFKPFLLKGKKRYAGLKHEPGKKTKMDIKGFECVRRDFAPFVVSTQQKIFELLVGQEDIEGSVEYTKGVIHKLLQGEMPISELIMSKKLTQAPEKYKTKAIHVVLAERLKKELPETVAPKVGDRIPYIVRTGSEKLCMRGVQPEEIQSGKFQADLFYYMTKQAYEPFKRIFELVGDGYVTSVFEEYEKYKARITEMARKRKREEKEAATRRQLRVRDIRSFFGNRK